jgi:hypothetical protein
MKVKKTSTINELQKIMKQDMENGKNVSKKKIKKTMEKFVEDE